MENHEANEILVEREEEINKFLKELPEDQDPRSKRGRSFSLGELFLIVLCAQICGFETLREYEAYGNMKLHLLRKFLPYKRGAPSKSTLARLLSLWNPKCLEDVLLRWMKCIVSSYQDQTHIAIDGKAHRGVRTEEGTGKLHLVHAYAVERGLLLAQEKVAEKSNEITAIPKLLDALYIERQIVTIDAMGCQKAIAKKIREKKADYVLALKGNQGQFHADVELFLNDPKQLALAKKSEIADKGHGRMEIRRCYVSDRITWLDGKKKWLDLKTIAKVERISLEKGIETKEERLFISSLAADPEKILTASRAHWGIENNLHWTLDVVFREDDRIIWNQNFARNESTIRRVALNFLKKFQGACEYNRGKTKIAIKTLRKLLSGDDRNMEKLLRECG
jgi:predicted transposase YbfD/YdcC